MSDVDFKVGANADDANATLDKLADKAMSTGQRMQSAMREASYKMASGFKESFEKVNSESERVIETVKKMQGAMLAVWAVLAGGKVFKDAVNESVNMTKESLSLSRALGITVTEAGHLNIALGDIYQSSETLLAGNAKLTKQLNADEAAFKKLGVATRDQNGHFRNSLDIMLDVNAKLATFKEGTDRNIEANKVYGKSYAEMLPLIALTGTRLAEAKEKAEALGLTIGKEGVENTANYRAAMNDVGDVMDALQKTIGDALMPVLAKLGNWFSATGPALVTIFKGAIGGLMSTFWGLKLGVEVVFEAILASIEVVGASLAVIINGAVSVLNGDWAGAKAAWNKGGNDLADIAKRHLDRVSGSAQEAHDKILNLFTNQTPVTEPAGGATGTSDGGTKTKKESRSGEWEAKLAEMRDAFEKQKTEQGSFEEFGKARERDYWKNILNTVKLSTEERRQVSAKYYALERDLRKAAFESEIAEMRANLNAYREGSVERIQIAGEIAQKAGAKYGLESKEYKAAIEDMGQMARVRAKQQEQLDAMALERARAHDQSLLDLERVRIEESAALGDITETQKIAALGKLKEQEFQIELQAATERAALLTEDVVAYQQAMDKILEIKRKHELDKAKVEKDIKVANKKEKDDQFAPFEKAFEKSINGIIAGTTTLRKAMKNLTQSIALEFANMGVKMVVQWASNQLRMTLAAAAGAKARVGIDTAASVQSIAIGAGASLKSIMNSAAEAAAGAYKAVVGIPFVGPFLAPAAAGVAFAATAAFGGSVASARGGYDIPAGLNPMTQLHEREMVLPQKQADAVRNMAEGNGGGGNHYWNGAGGDFIHKNELAKFLKKMNRNFVSVK